LELEHKSLVAQSYFNLGILKRLQNDLESGLEYSNKALTMFKKLNDCDGQAEVLIELAILDISLKDFDHAFELLEEAKHLSTEVDDPELDIELFHGFACYHFGRTNFSDSLKEVSEAIKTAEKYYLPAWECYKFRAKLHVQCKDKESASRDILRCVEFLDNILKHVPEEYQETFRGNADVQEAYILMKEITESD
jgi:tetratricopeptide (TPR) repeat protein